MIDTGFDSKPVAKVERIGRWYYIVYISTGYMRYGPNGYGWHVWGRKRAEKKAKKVLARYKRREALRSEKWTVADD